jgi:hypothetical protein
MMYSAVIDALPAMGWKSVSHFWTRNLCHLSPVFRRGLPPFPPPLPFDGIFLILSFSA